MSLEILDLPAKAELDWHDPGHAPESVLKTDLIPFSEFLNLYRRMGESFHMAPMGPFFTEAYEELLEDPAMKDCKDHYKYNAFSMEPESLLFLKEVIQTLQPRVVWELGSGISTPILAKAQADVFKDCDLQPVYVSVDQDENYLETTRDLLERADAEQTTRLLHFPLCFYRVGDKNANEEDEKVLCCYRFDEAKLHEASNGLRPDLIIIDGPTSSTSTDHHHAYARMLTVPVLSVYASARCPVFLDDAYRSSEIFEMRQWHETQTAYVAGVKAVGKGMGVAFLNV